MLDDYSRYYGVDLRNIFDRRSWEYQLRYLPQDPCPRFKHWYGSIDANGYVREKSLRYLIDNYRPGDENRILLRLEDWVKPIYDLALDWTRENFHKLSLNSINDNYQLILYLSRKEKLKNSEAIKIINSGLIEKITNVDQYKFHELHNDLRKYIYSTDFNDKDLLRSLLSSDIESRNKLLLLEYFKFGELTQEEVNLFSQDKSVFVKRNFLYYRIEYYIKPSQDELSSLILHKNPNLRKIAAYYLKKYYYIDAYDIYKARRDEKFYYIADYFRQQDIDYFFQGLDSKRNKIKLLCLKAICNINPNYLKQIQWKQLILESGKFRRVILSHINTILSLGELKDHKNLILSLNNGESLYLKLLRKKSYWDYLESCLDFLISNTKQKNIEIAIADYYQSRPTNLYKNLEAETKAKIYSQIEQLESNTCTNIQKLCQDVDFLISNR